jgi:protocatechuate 3,4-dioxygenase beta subunit
MRRTIAWLPVMMLSPSLLVAQRPRVAPADAPSQQRIAPAGEAGAPLTISGIVVDSEGKAIANASIYVFQTDARGYYSAANQNAEQTARIHGYLRTDRAGRFNIRTIRPGGYPNATIPQHVHFFVNAPGQSERVFEIVFEDDSRMTDRIRSESAQPNSMFALCKPERRGDTQHCDQRVIMTR